MRALSPKVLKTIRSLLLETVRDQDGRLLVQSVEAIDRALSVRKGSTQRRAAKREKKKTKRDETAAIREAVLERAGDQCEFIYPSGDRCSHFAEEMDHFFSRRNGQSVSSCWGLCGAHHRLKTDNSPSAAYWLESFIDHCQVHPKNLWMERKKAENRLAFVRARSKQLEAKP
jgi:hypothetical protein